MAVRVSGQKAPVTSGVASPKKAFKVPAQIASFQASHVNTVVYMSESRIAQLLREKSLGFDKLIRYLEALRTVKWNDNIEPFSEMKEEGLEFGRFYVKFGSTPHTKPVLLTFLAERKLIEALKPLKTLKPGQAQVINIVHRGKMKSVIFDRFLTSRHDLEDAYEEETSEHRIIITAESLSTKYGSRRPGLHRPYIGEGMQIEIEVRFPGESTSVPKEED